MVIEVNFFHQKANPGVLIITFLQRVRYSPVRTNGRIIYSCPVMITRSYFRIKVYLVTPVGACQLFLTYIGEGTLRLWINTCMNTAYVSQAVQALHVSGAVSVQVRQADKLFFLNVVWQGLLGTTFTSFIFLFWGGRFGGQCQWLCLTQRNGKGEQQTFVMLLN